MKLLVFSLFAFFTTISQPRGTVNGEWEPLLDTRLTKWENYLSYRHKIGYTGDIPKDSKGNELRPIGFNKDNTGVFTVLDRPEGPVLRVSGEIYGCLFSRESYDNYHLKLQVKWGKDKYEPRKNMLRDSGILYHSNGKPGQDYWRSWMPSHEFQVMEGHMGDYWRMANSAIDIRSFPSESAGIMSPVADMGQPFLSYKSGSDSFCLRSINYESPANEWTTLELICFEGKSLHIVNGHVVMVLKNSRYIDADGRETPLTKGKIQLQSEAAEVFYRDIQIKRLTAMPKGYEKLFIEQGS